MFTNEAGPKMQPLQALSNVLAQSHPNRSLDQQLATLRHQAAAHQGSLECCQVVAGEGAVEEAGRAVVHQRLLLGVGVC